MLAITTTYSVLKLHSRSDDAWAVVEVPSGKIASDLGDKLLMRMTKPQAEAMAAKLKGRMAVFGEAAGDEGRRLAG